MRLSDRDIHKYLGEGELVIVGTFQGYSFDRFKQVQPCSIDLRLGTRFFKFKDEIKQFDVKDLDNVWSYLESFEIPPGQKILLQPYQIIFGQIYEQLRIPPDCSGLIEGRSRFARLGLSIHATGGFINPEFEGAMPLQIINNNNIPIVIYSLMNVCQLILVKLSSKPLIPYPRRSNNPYHKELYASPSVSHIDPILRQFNEELPNLNVEVERRLVEKYLKDIEYDRLGEKLRASGSYKMSGDREPKPKGDTIIIRDSHFGAINTGEVARDMNTSFEVTRKERERSLADAALEIQQLLDQLSAIYPTTTVSERANVAAKVMEEIEKKPDTKGKIIKALKAGGTAALVELTNNPVVKILTPMLESLLED